MRLFYCTAINTNHLDSLTADYQNDGWKVVNEGNNFKVLHKSNECIRIEIEEVEK